MTGVQIIGIRIIVSLDGDLAVGGRLHRGGEWEIEGQSQNTVTRAQVGRGGGSGKAEGLGQRVTDPVRDPSLVGREDSRGNPGLEERVVAAAVPWEGALVGSSSGHDGTMGRIGALPGPGNRR